MKYIFFLLFSTMICAFAKAEKKDSVIKINKNSFYLELGGSAGNYSINYERMLIKKLRWSINVRLGIDPTYIIKNYYSFYPALNFLYGGKASKVELGIGELFCRYQDKIRDNGTYFIDNFYMAFDPTIGYRYILKNRFIFRATYTPFIFESFRHKNTVVAQGYEPGGPTSFYGGLSLGYSF